MAIGVVERRNDKGVQIQGEWHNYSKYASTADIAPCTVGDTVRLDEESGYIMALRVVSEAPPPSQAAAAVSAIERDVRIMRQALLNTATSILTSGGRSTSGGHVCSLAAELEKWVLRGEESCQ